MLCAFLGTFINYKTAILLLVSLVTLELSRKHDFEYYEGLNFVFLFKDAESFTFKKPGKTIVHFGLFWVWCREVIEMRLYVFGPISTEVSETERVLITLYVAQE
jgi:hypothetical protein